MVASLVSTIFISKNLGTTRAQGLCWDRRQDLQELSEHQFQPLRVRRDDVCGIRPHTPPANGSGIQISRDATYDRVAQVSTDRLRQTRAYEFAVFGAA